MKSAYISWLRSRGRELFEGAGHTWIRVHRRALIPATIGPCYIQLTQSEARDLLRASSAWLVRYSSDPSVDATEWFDVVCDRYDPQTFSHMARRNVIRGKRDCRVARVEQEWLSQHGYPCFLASRSRYKGKGFQHELLPEDVWQRRILGSKGGPYEFWATFVGLDLVGYCMCAIDGNMVAVTSWNNNPAYFKHRPVDALVSALGEHYVRDLGRTITNGSRAVLHNTNMQDFLLDHGYRRQFCRLNVIYEGWFGLALGTVFPIRALIARLPDTQYLVQLNALLRHEEIRRACVRPLRV